TEAHHGGNERGSTVGDERQRNTGDRHKTDHGGDVDHGLADDPRHKGDGGQSRERGLDPAGHPQSGTAQNTEQAQDYEGADEPELLTDNGEDEVGLREGEETPLLLALPDTDTEDLSDAQRVQPVQGLIARALRVGYGVQESSDAAHPVGLDRDDGGSQSQDEGEHGLEELGGCSDHPQQGEEHQKQNQGGGQVRAQQDEHGDQATPWQQRDEQVSPLGEFPQFVLAGQYAGAPQGEGDLGRFGGLDEQPADLQPTQGTV